MSRNDHNKAYEEILAAYRDGDEDRYAEDFSEALDAVESDRELEQWFAEDQSFDAEFRSALSEFSAPEQKVVEPEPEKIIRIPFLNYAAAALVIFALSLFGLYRFDAAQQKGAQARVHDWRESMASFAASTFELDLMGNDLSKLRTLNVSNGGTYAAALDTVFAEGLPMGCKVLDWNGSSVSLYCFGNDQGQVVHCFVVPLEELNGVRAAQYLKSVIAHTERDTGGFVSGDTAYLLVASMPGVDIKPFLLPAQERYALAIKQSSVAALQLALLPLP